MTGDKAVLQKAGGQADRRLAWVREDFLPSLTAEERAFVLQPYDVGKLIPRAMACLFGTDGVGKPRELPFSWTFSADEGRVIPYMLQSFRYQNCLKAAYFRDGNDAYRDLFLNWIFDWIRAHPNIDRSDPWAWHDDATARRVFYFSSALATFHRLLSPEQRNLLRESLRMQAGLLRSEEFYSLGHNHGMYQDMALAMYALSCGEDAEYYLRLSMARSRVYFRRCFSEDGVHREHSPQYHTDMAGNLCWFSLAFREFDPAYSAELEETLRRIQEYILWITTPEGVLPSIGDSPKRRKDITYFWKSPEYRYTVSRGREGRPPSELMRVFPRAGYGVIRKDWGMDGEGTWMMLLAATHSEVHKHQDDLSFLLYHDGELITEAGSRNYSYSDPLTEYCYSSQGHNVLFVDGQGWRMKPTHLPLLEPEAYRTGIIGWEDTPELSSVTGRQVRFPGITQVRTLQYDRRRETVTVEDRITAENPAGLRLIYHLAPGIAVKQESPRCWQLLRNGARTAEIRIEGRAPDLSARLITESEPPWHTEVFWGSPEPQGGSLLLVDCSGSIGLNLVRMQIRLT